MKQKTGKRSAKASVYKKLHKWPGLIISFILLYYGITGVIMNHRELFSGVDISRKYLPEGFNYQNWNNSALKGNLIITKDSILVYGNIGIWVTDSAFHSYRPLNNGFPKGVDSRKVFDVHLSGDGSLYTATHSGLFAFNPTSKQWERFKLEVDIKRFVAIESVGDTLYALNRSYLFKGKSDGIYTRFEKIELSKPAGFKNEVTLFKTIWQIHSGEIFGISGKLFVDLLGVATIFLSITGITYFFFPGWIRRRKKRRKKAKTVIRVNKWSLKWHNKIGEWTFIFLAIVFLTGIFLRPPLLIAIAKLKVKPVKYSHLDQPNPWYDKLRDILYDNARDIFLISTSEGMFYMNRSSTLLTPFQNQPPVSVMGINTLQPYADEEYLIGSFSGLFIWDPSRPEVYNYAQGEVYKGDATGKPVGDFKVTGIVTNVEGKRYMVDYDKGAVPLYHSIEFPEMPLYILEGAKISLWNLSLEIHTGRIFKGLIGDFYILVVPLSGLTGAIVVISGWLLWRKRFRKKSRYYKQ